MLSVTKNALSDRTIWFMVGLVVLCVCLVLIIVFKHDSEKPKSPQALAAAAFNQIFAVKEWKPGMGEKPFMYHPAGFNRLAWKPLPRRTGPQAQMIGSGLWSLPPGSGGTLNSAPALIENHKSIMR